jgi:hypothetical protein
VTGTAEAYTVALLIERLQMGLRIKEFSEDDRVWAAETAVEEGVNAVDISFEAASQQRLVVLK